MSCGDGGVDDGSTKSVKVDGGLEGRLTGRVIFLFDV